MLRTLFVVVGVLVGLAVTGPVVGGRVTVFGAVLVVAGATESVALTLLDKDAVEALAEPLGIAAVWVAEVRRGAVDRAVSTVPALGTPC